jgi:hypothetical protein
MNRDDIIRMAREAEAIGNTATIPLLARFAALVAAADRDRMIADGWRQCAVGQRTTQWCAEAERIRAEEREECAKVCEETTASWTQQVYNGACMDCATAIRARGKTAQPAPDPDLSYCPYCGGPADCEPETNLNFCRRCQRA